MWVGSSDLCLDVFFKPYLRITQIHQKSDFGKICIHSLRSLNASGELGLPKVICLRCRAKT